MKGTLSYESLTADSGSLTSQDESTFSFGLWSGKKTVWFASSIKYSELKSKDKDSFSIFYYYFYK